MDHLGTGDSSTHDPFDLTYARLAASAAAADREVLSRLADGTLTPGLPSIADPVRIGIGQSMGGCLAVVQQAHHRSYDGIAVLGSSAVHIQPPVPPGEDPVVAPWALRDTPASDPPMVVNAAEVAAAHRDGELPPVLKWMNWYFYGDDIDPASFGDTSGWTSATVPGVTDTILSPAVIATEAAAIRVPVLVAMGDRDVVRDPKEEPRAYRSATSVDLFVCPRMAHMHNFAPTATLFWNRLDRWGAWVRDLRLASF
jgi:pimeloyl-ACP methyl ester carboxylesterase